MFIELHRTFTEEKLLIKVENILYIKDSFYYLPGKLESEKSTEVCLNGYDYLYDAKGHLCKTRIKFGVVETPEQILKILSDYYHK